MHADRSWNCSAPETFIDTIHFMRRVTPIEVFKTALKDPQIRIAVISPAHNKELVKIINGLTADEYISEWRHNMWNVRYEYHKHKCPIASELKQLYDQGICGGNPKLTHIYSRSDLEKIIHSQMVPSS